MLIQRRDKIGQAYLNAINPVVNLALDGSDTLTFENAAVAADVATEPASGYVVRWFTFDNATGATAPIGSPTATTDRQVKAPAVVPSELGAIVKVQIAAADPAHPSWATPVDAYFRRERERLDAGGSRTHARCSEGEEHMKTWIVSAMGAAGDRRSFCPGSQRRHAQTEKPGCCRCHCE